MDLRMNSVDFYVIPSPGISGSLGQILQSYVDRTESSKCEGVNGSDANTAVGDESSSDPWDATQPPPPPAREDFDRSTSTAASDNTT